MGSPSSRGDSPNGHLAPTLWRWQTEARLNNGGFSVRDSPSLRDAVMLYTDFSHVGQHQNAQSSYSALMLWHDPIQPHLGRVPQLSSLLATGKAADIMR